MNFIYKLKLVDRLIPEENWTKEDERVISDHFAYLSNLKNKGILLLAGKTDGQDPNTYGIAIFKAETLEEATSICNNDPAVKNEIMTATLQQFNIALLSSTFTK